VGFLDDREGPIHKLVNEWRVALPLHGEWGTGPNVFYVPPISPPLLNEDRSPDEERPRVPLEYLEGLFGVRVGEALATLKRERAKTRGGDKSELMDILTVYHWNDLFGPFTRDPASVRPAARRH
jgi:ethylbenzene hydroxylase subunit beta/complex iron-sulfur molybdoenzyme family reductase subunit beta